MRSRRGGRRPPGLVGVLVTALVASSCGAVGSGGDGVPVVTWYARPESGGSTVDAADQCTQQAAGAYRVEVEPLPADASAQRQQLVRRLAARDSDIDLISMDVVWTAEFAEAGWVVPWPEDVAAELSQGVIPAVLETGRYDDRMYGAPLNTGSQLLWYRTDLVPEAPATWDAMVDAAEDLPPDVGRIEVQAARYEGYMVWFNSLLASAGGEILAGPTEASLEQEPTEVALGVIARLASSTAASPSMANDREDTTSQDFLQGRAAFMVNYPFVYAAAKSDAPEVFENLGVARWPAVVEGQPSRVTLGGFNLGVGAYSQHEDLALEAARCLLSPENQLRRAVQDGLPPVQEALYADPAFREANPFADLLLATFRDGSQRPASPAYNDITLAVLSVIHPPSGIDPSADVRRLRSRVDDAVNSRGLF